MQQSSNPSKEGKKQLLFKKKGLNFDLTETLFNALGELKKKTGFKDLKLSKDVQT
jgi:hypothetical protein